MSLSADRRDGCPTSGGNTTCLDVHGAGSQRSDPKAGDPSQFPRGRGPQGDVIDIYNMVRPVRGGKASHSQQRPGTEAAALRTTWSRPGPRGPAGMGPGDMGPGRQGPGGMGPGGPMGGNRPGFVSRLDRDGDGKVSRKEFDGPAEAFDRLDANQDGYLIRQRGAARSATRCEQPGMALPLRSGKEQSPRSTTTPRQGLRGVGASPFLQRFDRNNDGKVTRDEFDGTARRFSTLDLNGDGSVSKDEAAQGSLPAQALEWPDSHFRR